MEIEDVGYEIQKHIDKKYKNLTEYCKHEDIGYKKFAEKLKSLGYDAVKFVEPKRGIGVAVLNTDKIINSTPKGISIGKNEKSSC